MKYPAYPKYKDSGVEWLGEIPADWVVSRIGFEAWVRARLGWKGLKAEEYVDEGYIFLSTPNIKDREIDFENVNYINNERYAESPEIQLRIGDVLLAKDGSTLGTVNIVRKLPKPATVNSSIAVITPYKRLYGFFLKFLLDSGYMKAVIQLFRGGMGVPHLFQEDINKFYIPIPELRTQKCIATFLDTETAKIDGLIKDYEELIALLQEKRQALISHAVTRGLSELVSPDDPEFGEWAKPVKFKDSGVEWLGEIPEGWDVGPVKWYFQTLSGSTPDTNINENYNGTISWIRTTDLNDMPLSCGEIFISELALKNSACKMLPSETVLIAMYGGEGTIGKSGLLTSPSTVNQALCGILPASCSSPFFLHYFVQFYRPYWMIGAESSRKDPNISQAQIRDTKFVFPSLREQQHIAKYLTQHLQKVDSLILETESSISLLNEHRSALITNAVTGKINVEALV